MQRSSHPRASAAYSSELIFATLNISGPSLERAQGLADYLLSLDADVVVLTETRANAGTQLLYEILRCEGYALIAAGNLKGQERGAAIAHRLTCGGRNVRPEVTNVTLDHRLPVFTARLGRATVTIAGAYVPSRDTSPEKVERKSRFLVEMCSYVREATRNSALILLGDLNVVGRTHVPKYRAFRSWEYDALDELAEAGMVDAHAELNPTDQAHSWIGRTGDGYCYDYGLVSTELLPSVVRTEYSHCPRDRGLSDHAAVVMVIDPSQIVESSEWGARTRDYAMAAV